MSGEVSSIVEAYDVLGMSVSEIAIDRELDSMSVKAALMQGSKQYRRDCGQESVEEDKLNFSNNDLEAANEVIRNLMVYSEDDILRFKAAVYVRDDKKGRKEVVKLMQGNTFNILAFNEQISKVREMANGAKQKVLSKMIEV